MDSTVSMKLKKVGVGVRECNRVKKLLYICFLKLLNQHTPQEQEQLVTQSSSWQYLISFSQDIIAERYYHIVI